ncbi:MAG: tetratricopeptide repeat protein [Spirochaetales bacterium]|nr:tetratricopeptide repeat protein [Spirochaetales bacterium]
MSDQFNTSKSDYVNALVNIGNIYFIENKLQKALKYLHKAQQNDPMNPRVRLAYARLIQLLQEDQRIHKL